MVILEVRELTRYFGGLAALFRVSFQVEEGAIVGIIGPNGAGKTTLFNLIAGALRPTSGEMEFEGRRLSPHLRPWDRCHLGIARTFQIPRPFAALSCLENVAAAAHFGRLRRPMPDAVAHAREILGMVGLDPEAPAGLLSVGNSKKLELARALATGPRLLLVDEVAAGLNPTETAEIVEVIRAIRRSGVTVLLIEHVMQAVMALCERVVVLHRGELLTQGAPEQVARDPRVVEAYLGEETGGAHP